MKAILFLTRRSEGGFYLEHEWQGKRTEWRVVPLVNPSDDSIEPKAWDEDSIVTIALARKSRRGLAAVVKCRGAKESTFWYLELGAVNREMPDEEL